MPPLGMQGGLKEDEKKKKEKGGLSRIAESALARSVAPMLSVGRAKPQEEEEEG